MLKYIEIVDAVNTVNGNRQRMNNDSTVNSLVCSLELYKDRGEFDGTIKSAKKCLRQADYEIEKGKTLKYFTTGSGQIELSINYDDAFEGHHSGQCEQDIYMLMKLPYIKDQLKKIDKNLLIAELKEYGIEANNKSHKENLGMMLWLACGDITEREEFDCDDCGMDCDDTNQFDNNGYTFLCNDCAIQREPA